MTDEPLKFVALDSRFIYFLGHFHFIWATVELILCFALAKQLKITDEEAHVLTAGMEFGRKITLLRNLIYRGTDPNRDAIMGLLNKIQNESKRNVFAHPYIKSDSALVTFIERSRGGEYKVSKHEFSVTDFIAHVEDFGNTAHALEKLLVPSHRALEEFAAAAFSTDSKATKSPIPLSSSA